jgi:DNA polymerase V
MGREAIRRLGAQPRARSQALGHAYRYKKAGVMLLDLHPAGRVLEGLFHKRDDARRMNLKRTLDSLNRRYGRATLAFAATGLRQPWKMQRDRLSPCYTTDWEGPLRV